MNIESYIGKELPNKDKIKQDRQKFRKEEDEATNKPTTYKIRDLEPEEELDF